MSLSQVEERSWNAEDAGGSSQPDFKGKNSVEKMFEQCVNDIKEAAQRTPPPVASQLNSIARRVDDSYFRLQIWGSEMGADSKDKITFTDILKFEDSLLSVRIEEILEHFRRNFNIIGETLIRVLDNPSNTEPDDLLVYLRSAANEIHELVRSFVDLSGPIQIEQALQLKGGPYKALQVSIDGTNQTFLDRCVEEAELSEPLSQIEPDLAPSSPTVKADMPQPATSGLNASIPWAGSHLLTLDGGGVRSYSTLIILRELMQTVGEMEEAGNPDIISSFHPFPPPPILVGSTKSVNRKTTEYLPCHYFDYIVGTSTGGLIALMLGRLRMNICNSIDAFVEFTREVFGKPRFLSIPGPRFFFREKHDHKKFEKMVRDLVHRESREQLSGREQSYRQLDSRMCRTMVLAYGSEPENVNMSPVLLRSFADPTGPEAEIQIWEAARATTAAPIYFKSIEIRHETFRDGSFGAKNPTVQAFMHVRSIHENQKQHESGRSHVALVVSIGTGRTKPVSRVLGGLRQFSRTLKDLTAMMSDLDDTHSTMENYSAISGELHYSRLNVLEGLQDVKIDDWRPKTMAHIEQASLRYLNQPETQQELRRVAAMLVENRQRRSLTPKWAAFCGHIVKATTAQQEC